MFHKLRTYKSFKVLFLAVPTVCAIFFSSCEDQVVYEPIDAPDTDCQGSYCKLDKNGEDEINFFALLINSSNPETF